MPVTRALLLAAVIAATACVPAAVSSTPTPASPTPSAPPASPTPAGTVAPTPRASRSPIVLPNIAQVAAAGNGVVWMQVGPDRLFRSLDRGETWTERDLPQAGTAAMAFVDADHGWVAVAGSPGTQCQSQSVQIWATIDGATSWNRLPGTGIADAQCKGAFAFRDATHGYLSAWDPNHAPVVYRTADGGRTWSASAPIADPPGFTTQAGGASLQPGPVADFGSVLLVNAYGQLNGATRVYAFRSTDGGASWAFAGTPPTSQSGVVFLTPSRWFALIVPGPSAETTDGGATWHPFASDYQQAAPIAPQVVFGDANTGYATVRGGLQRTIDGGAHWTPLKTPGT